jgi:hypothetical protein
LEKLWLGGWFSDLIRRRNNLVQSMDADHNEHIGEKEENEERRRIKLTPSRATAATHLLGHAAKPEPIAFYQAAR